MTGSRGTSRAAGVASRSRLNALIRRWSAPTTETRRPPNWPTAAGSRPSRSSSRRFCCSVPTETDGRRGHHRRAAAVRYQLDGVRRESDTAARRQCARHRRGHRACIQRLGPRMGPLVHRPQPGTATATMGVQLRGLSRGVTEQLLDHPQVRRHLPAGGCAALCHSHVRPLISAPSTAAHGLVHRSACRRTSNGPGTQQRVPGLRDRRDGRRPARRAAHPAAGCPGRTVRCLLPLPSTQRSQPMAGVDVVDVQGRTAR